MKEGLRKRLAESLEAASQLADGILEIELTPPAASSASRPGASGSEEGRAEGAAEGPGAEVLSGPSAGKRGEVLVFSEKFACLNCGTSMPELEPRIFSFNSPHGCCPRCLGLGFQRVIDPELIVPDPTLSISEGALEPWTKAASVYHRRLLEAVAEANGIDTDVAVARPARLGSRAAAGGNRGRAPHDLLSQSLRPPAQVHGPLRGHAPQPPAPLREHRFGEHARPGRVADGAAAVPGVPRRPPAPREPRGHGRRAQHLRVHPALGEGGARLDRRARADRDRARDRPPRGARDRRAAALPRLGGDRLPVARAVGDDALRR